MVLLSHSPWVAPNGEGNATHLPISGGGLSPRSAALFLHFQEWRIQRLGIAAWPAIADPPWSTSTQLAAPVPPRLKCDSYRPHTIQWEPGVDERIERQEATAADAPDAHDLTSAMESTIASAAAAAHEA